MIIFKTKLFKDWIYKIINVVANINIIIIVNIRIIFVVIIVLDCKPAKFFFKMFQAQ